MSRLEDALLLVLTILFAIAAVFLYWGVTVGAFYLLVKGAWLVVKHIVGAHW